MFARSDNICTNTVQYIDKASTNWYGVGKLKKSFAQLEIVGVGMQTAQGLMHLSKTPLFNTKAVVQETAVPADTLRAWERRYGIPAPQRSEGGHRLYSEYDIALIVWLRDRIAEGLTISQAIALLQNSAGQGQAASQSGRAEMLSFDQLSSALIEALSQFNARAAEHILGQALALYSVEEVCIDLIQPTLLSIGKQWYQATLSITQEHFASQFIRRKLDALLHSYTHQNPVGTVVVGCAPKELHEIGALILAVFLARARWRVIYLGQSVAYDGLIACLKQIQADVVCLSATSLDTATELRDLAYNLLADLPTVRFVYGGQAFNHNPGLCLEMPGDFLGEDAWQALERMQAFRGSSIAR